MLHCKTLQHFYFLFYSNMSTPGFYFYKIPNIIFKPVLLYFNMKKAFFIILKVSGILFISLALLCGWGALTAYLERAQHGAGLMFADAEIFLLLTILFLLLGIVSLWIAKRFKA